MEIRFNFLSKDDLIKAGFTPDKDQLVNLDAYLNFSMDRINAITGNVLGTITYEKLSASQQYSVKWSAIRYAIWLIQNGMQWFRGSMSVSANGISISQGAPDEPDYVLKDITNNLQQTALFIPRLFTNTNNSNQEFLNGQDVNTNPALTRGDYWLSGNTINKLFLRQDKGITSKDGSVTIVKYLNDNYPSIDLSAQGSGGKSIESVDIERTGSIGNETGSFDKETGKLLLKLAPFPTVAKDTTYIPKWVLDNSNWTIKDGNFKRNEPLTNETDLLLDIQCVTGTIISNRETQGFLAVGNDKPFSYLNGAGNTNWKVSLDDLSTINFEANALKNDNFQIWRLTLVGTAPTPLEIDSKYFKGDGTVEKPLTVEDTFMENVAPNQKFPTNDPE